MGKNYINIIKVSYLCVPYLLLRSFDLNAPAIYMGTFIGQNGDTFLKTDKFTKVL